MSNPICNDHNVPSPETLADIYICVEAEEEVLVAPRKTEQPNNVLRKNEIGSKAPETQSGPDSDSER